MEDILDRTMYKDIKSMNREQMESFLKRVFENGYRKALEDRPAGTAQGTDTEKLRNELAKINGIGSKRLEEIMSVIEKSL